MIGPPFDTVGWPNVLPVPGPGFRGRCWPQAHCEQTKVQSQTARAFDPGFLGPDVGQFAMNSRPTPTHDRPQKPGPGTGTNNEQLNYWVLEGSLARFCLGALLGSGRLRGPGRALKKVGGGDTPPQFEGVPWPPGPARPPKRTQQKPGQTACRYPNIKEVSAWGP